MNMRLDPKIRAQQILDAALRVATREGYHKMTREKIALEAGTVAGNVSRYYSTMPQLRRAVVRAAISKRVLPVIASALAAGDKHAKAAPVELKKAAVATLT